MDQLSAAELEQLFKSLVDTNVTKTSHRKLYPALEPSRKEMSQAGRVVLITGGGTGVGFSIARAFVQANAATVIIIGRRTDVLSEAASKLAEEAKLGGTDTKIVHHTCDITDFAEVDRLWEGFAASSITVDVFVSNAAKFTEPKPLLELGFDEVWSQVEINSKAPFYFMEKFSAQPTEKQKFVVNVSSQIAHMTAHPGVVVRPAYTWSKMTALMMFQLIAQNTSSDKIQIVTFHPGLIYSAEWKAMGLGPEWFDEDELCGAFAVWLATKDASFLHGRFLWAAWDINELKTEEFQQRITDDPYYLKGSVVGLNGGMKA